MSQSAIWLKQKEKFNVFYFSETLQKNRKERQPFVLILKCKLFESRVYSVYTMGLEGGTALAKNKT